MSYKFTFLSRPLGKVILTSAVVVLMILTSYALLTTDDYSDTEAAPAFVQTDDGVKWYYSEIQGGVKITSISNVTGKILEIPSSLTINGANKDVIEIESAGAVAFSTVKKLVIPETVKSIKNYAFNGNLKNLRTIEFSGESQLENIGDGAFAYAGYNTGTSTVGSNTSGVKIDDNAILLNDSSTGKGYYSTEKNFTLKVECDSGFILGRFNNNSLSPAVLNSFKNCSGVILHTENNETVDLGKQSSKYTYTPSKKYSAGLTVSFENLNSETYFYVRFCKMKDTWTSETTPTSSDVQKACYIKIYYVEPPIAEDSMESLTVTLPDSVKTIGDNCFNCATEVVLNQGLESIGSGALTKLSKVTIPASVKTLGLAFNNDVDISFAEGSTLCFDQSARNLLSSDGKTLIWSLSKSETYEFPDKVEVVKEYAFKNNEHIKSVAIPAGITWGMFPFYNTAINKVIFEESLTEIPDYIFAGTKLTDITIPSQIVSVGTKAFYDISTLESVTFEDNSHISEIKDYAFFKNNIKTVKFLSSARGYSVNIGVGAFYNNSNLSSIVVGDEFSINTIGDAAFAKSATSAVKFSFGPADTTGVLIPTEVTSIGNYAFSAVKNTSGSAEQEPSTGFLRSNVDVTKITSSSDDMPVSFETGSKIISIGKYAFDLGMVSTIDLSYCSALETISDEAFSTYKSIKLPSGSALKTLYGISNHASGSNISVEDNDILIPASVEAMYPIQNVDTLSFGEGSALKKFEYRYGTITTEQKFDLSKCLKLESVSIPVNGSTTLPAGIYSIAFSKSSSVSDVKGTISNAADVLLDESNLEITSSTIAINSDLLGIQTLTINGVNERFSLENGCLISTVGSEKILAGVAQIGLKEVNINSDSKITAIADCAFRNSSVESLVIEKGISVGSCIFDGCNTISSVSLLADPSTMKLADDSFLIQDDLVFKLTKSSGTSVITDLNLTYTSPGLTGTFNRSTVGAETLLNGLYLGEYGLSISGSRITGLTTETMPSSLIEEIKVNLTRDGNKTKMIVTVPESALNYDMTIELSTKKAVNFHLLQGYDIQTAFANTVYYWAYGQAGSFVSVPETVDGQTVNVSDVVSKTGSTSFALSFDGGYTLADMNLAVNTGDIKIGGSVITVTSPSDSILTITKKPRTADNMVKITFYSDEGKVGGSDSYTVRIPYGCTIVDSEIPEAIYSGHVLKDWCLKGSDSPYDFDTTVVKDIYLKAKWDVTGNTITISTSAADIQYAGKTVTEIPVTEDMTSVELSYKVREGYEVRAWVVSDGTDTKTIPVSENPTLTIDDLSKSLTVSLEYRYASSSAGLLSVVNRDLPSASEIRSAVEVFEFGGSVDTSGSQWIGHNSVPLIVDNYIYVRAGGATTSEPGKIYKIESDTGYIVASAESSGTRAFYHQVSYGNGVIYDYITGQAYDLDLKPIFKVDRSTGCVEYYDGYFYTSGTTMYRFPADTSATGTVSPEKVGTFEKEVYGSYGFTSSIFLDHYIYRIYADGTERGITAMDLQNPTKVASVKLTGMENLLLDDGWISEYNGTLYLTGYTTGLFGVVSTTDKDDRVGYVKVDGLNFGTAGYYEFEGSKSFASEFIVVNGFGFVKADALYVFDLRADGAVPSAETLVGKADYFPGGHGSIVVDVTDASAENGWMTYIYSIPYYTDTTTMAVMEAHMGSDGKFEFNLVTTASMQRNQYNSQAVRSDYDGRIVWYNDSGHIFSYTVPAKNNYYFYVSDGTNSVWYKSTGATAADALKALGSDVAVLDAQNALVSVWGSSNASDWSLSMLELKSFGKSQYQWTVLNNLYDTTNDTNHYYAILKGCSIPEKDTEMSYISDGGEVSTYSFADNIGDRSVIGKKLILGSEVYTIRFYNGNVEIEDSALIGAKNSVVSGSFPTMYKPGHVAYWVIKGTDTRVTVLPETFTANQEYEVKWIEAAYSLEAEVETVGDTIFFDFTAAVKTGENDLMDAHIIVFAKYENGFFMKSFSGELDFADGDATVKLGVGSDRLSYIIAYLVEGTPTTQTYSDYAEYKYMVAGTGS